MRYFGSVVTDVGIVKTTNQDSASIQIADIAGYGQTALISVCDGMGGLAKGELASATVIQRLRWWFSHELPGKMPQLSWEAISAEWTKMLREENEKLLQYGKKHSVSLGTTCSAMLLVSDRYMIAHVGDSRVYKITDHVQQVTEDQTFINREVQAGRMTPQEAAVNPKRNMLLQCVGASRVVTPDILFGTVEPDTCIDPCRDVCAFCTRKVTEHHCHGAELRRISRGR